MGNKIDKAFKFGFFAYALFLPFSISGAQAAMGFLILVWGASFVSTKKTGYRFAPIDPIIAIFLFWMLCSSLFAVDTGVTFSKIRRYWIFLGYFAVARAALDHKTAIKALKILCISAGFVAVYSILQHLIGNALPRPLAPAVDLYQETGGYFHSVGLFDHHLTYGNSLLLIILTSLGLIAYSGYSKISLPYALSVTLATAALIFSYARSAWLGFLAGVAAFGFQLGRKVLIPLLICLGLVFGLAATLSDSVRTRAERIVSFEHNIERVYIWKTTIDMIRDHPVTGIGIGNYKGLTDQYRKDYNIHWTARSHAHNSYLQVAVENGLPAIVLFGLWLAVLIGISGVKAANEPDPKRRYLLYALVSAHVGFAISSVFQHNLGDAEVAMTWFILIAVNFRLIQNDTD